MNKRINRIDLFSKSFASRQGGGGGGGMPNRSFMFLVGAALGFLTIHTTAWAASWATDETQRVLTVATGETYSLTDQDVADLVSSGKDFAVRGAGKVVCAVDMSNFAKDAVIEEGITFSVTAQYCFGKNKGKVTIQKDAALCLDAAQENILQNKEVLLEGDGPDGKGALQVNFSVWNSFWNDTFKLTGETRIWVAWYFAFNSSLDTCGHALVVDGNEWDGFGGTIKNSSETASRVTCKVGSTGTFEGSADNVLILTNGSLNASTEWWKDGGWAWSLQGDTFVRSSQWVADGASASLDICNVSSPLAVQGSSRFTVRTNSVMTVSGPLSGTGAITVDGGWLNLASTNVTYTGEIRVAAKAGHEPSWRAGLALRTDTALPLSGLSFADADLMLGDTFASALPPLAFTGEGATNRVTGGWFAPQRLPSPMLTVADGATVEVSSPLAVANAEVGAGGTLRLVEAALVGNPGLMGYANHPEATNWRFDKPTEAELSANYTNRYPHGADALAFPEKRGKPRDYRFHGYIWNRSTADATWSFRANFLDRTWMWLDGESVFEDAGGSNPDKPSVATVSGIKPGEHEIVLIFTASPTSDGPLYLGDYGLCALGFDDQGRNMSSDVGQYYRPLVDPGDGSLLTVDTATTVDAALYLPNFTNLAFGVGATFDGGACAQTVETLAGCPTVTNVPTLTVNQKFTVKLADFVAGACRPCTADGKVVFGAGAIIDVELPAQLTAEQKRALRGGAPILSAASIEGTPQLSEAARNAHFRLSQQAGTLTLSRERGMVFCIR